MTESNKMKESRKTNYTNTMLSSVPLIDSCSYSHCASYFS